MMSRYVLGLAVVLAIPWCMGQSCASSFLGSVAEAISDELTDDDTTDDSDDTDDTTTDKGVPAGAYAGTETMVVSRDNLSDAYPAETYTTTFAQVYTFGSDGRLVRSDGTAIAVGDAVYTSTQYGEVEEIVTGIGVGTNVTQYTSEAAMTMAGGAGLTWTLTGTGVHTFRLTGGRVLYEGSVEMESNTAGGVAYDLTIEQSATLTE